MNTQAGLADSLSRSVKGRPACIGSGDISTVSGIVNDWHQFLQAVDDMVGVILLQLSAGIRTGSHTDHYAAAGIAAFGYVHFRIAYFQDVAGRGYVQKGHKTVDHIRR